MMSTILPAFIFHISNAFGTKSKHMKKCIFETLKRNKSLSLTHTLQWAHRLKFNSFRDNLQSHAEKNGKIFMPKHV